MRRLAMLGVGALLWPLGSDAVVPESGIYHDPSMPGRGYIIEVQGGIVSVIVYAHDELTGRPDWFIASGRLRDDGDEVPGTDPLPFAGYYPLHWMSSPLYRYSGGPCLVCFPPRDSSGNQQPLTGERVGTLGLYSDFLKRPSILIDADPGVFQTDNTVPFHVPTRTNFGHLAFGRAGQRGLVDQKGRWLFAFQERTRAPVDVVWGTPDVIDFGITVGELPMTVYRLEYRDQGSDWSMTCRIGYRSLRPPHKPPGVTRNGCEVMDRGVVVFSALELDIGLNEIAAFAGPLPEDASETLRGPLTIRGRRFE